MIFMGKRTDIPRILNACDLFVLPSRWEGLPLVLAEAHAAGLPIVATKVGGNSEVVQDGKAGILVPAGDPKSLADAVETLITHPEMAMKMGREGRAFVKEHFNMKECVARYAGIYRSLVGERMA